MKVLVYLMLVDQLSDTYNSTLTEITDRFAPLHTICTNTCSLSPWIDDDCRRARRECRRLERKYRRSRTDIDLGLWTRAMRKRHELFRQKHEEYWLKQTNEDACFCAKLWRSLQKLLNRKDQKTLPEDALNADGFARCFQEKISDIKESFESNDLPFEEKKITNETL